MGFENPVVGGTSLRIPAIQSPNYQAGSAGWIIRIDGSAEFNNLTIRGTFNGSDFIMNADGVFIYSGTPAAGNLIANISATSGTDAFGNAYLAGINSYIGTGFVGLNAGNLNLGLTASPGQGGTVGPVGGDGLSLNSPVTATNPAASALTLLDGSTSVTPQSAAGYPHLQMFGTLWAANAVIHATDNANTWTPETWQTPTFSGTWSSTGTLNGNSTFRGMQYRKDAEDNVWILGGATTTGAGGSIFTLPSGYFNSTRRHLLPCWILHAGAISAAFAQVTETGIVNIASTLANVTIGAGDQVFINGKFPIGNIG